MLLDVYAQLLTNFKTGNVTQAGNLFSPEVKEKYTATFNAIPDLKVAAAQMGTIKQNILNENFAEYLIIQEKDGKKYAYPLYFTQGVDGIWRIDAM